MRENKLKFTNFFRISIISKCGIQDMTIHQIRTLNYFIIDHSKNRKIDQNFTISLGRKKIDTCVFDEKFDDFRSIFENHISKEKSYSFLMNQTKFVSDQLSFIKVVKRACMIDFI